MGKKKDLDYFSKYFEKPIVEEEKKKKDLDYFSKYFEKPIDKKEEQPSLREQMQEDTVQDVLKPDTTFIPTIEQKIAEERANKRDVEQYKKNYLDMGESVLYDAQDITNNLQKEAYEQVRNDISDLGAEKYSLETSVSEYMSMAPDSFKEMDAKKMVFEDDFKYWKEKYAGERDKQIIELQATYKKLDKEVTDTSDPEKIRMKKLVKFKLEKLMGESWKPLLDDKGEYVDQKWARGEEKTAEIQEKAEQYSHMNKEALLDMFHKLVAQDRYYQDVFDRNIKDDLIKASDQPIVGAMGTISTSDITMRPYINKANRLNESWNPIKDELEAIGYALYLNRDPESLSGGFFNFVGRGTKEQIEQTLGVRLSPTETKMQEQFAAGVKRYGGKLTEAQEESVKRDILDKAGMATGASAVIMLEMMATKSVIGGAKKLVNAKKYYDGLIRLATNKYGKTGAAVVNLMAGVGESGLLFGLTPDESITTAMGIGEGIAEKAMNFVFKGKKVGRLAEFLTRTTAGMTAETAAEFSGNFVNALVENGMDMRDALTQTFGKTDDEVVENVLVTMLTTAIFSAGSNVGTLVKFKNAVDSNPNATESDKAAAQQIIDDAEKASREAGAKRVIEKIETDAKENEKGTEEPVQEKRNVEGDVQQVRVRDNAQAGLETKKGKEVTLETTKVRTQSRLTSEALGQTVETKSITSDGQKVGEVSVGKMADGNSRLNNVSVDPESQGKGIGKETYRQLNKEANENGGVLVSSETMSDQARGVWESFVKSGEAEFNEAKGRYEFNPGEKPELSMTEEIEAKTKTYENVSKDASPKQKLKLFKDYVNDIKTTLENLGYKGKEVQSLITKAVDIQSRIENAEIKGEDFIRDKGKRKSFENLRDEFGQAVQNVVQKATAREVKSVKGEISNIVGKKRTRKQSGKPVGTSVDEETGLYFEEAKKVTKAAPEELMNMEYSAIEALQNNPEGSYEHTKALATLSALEDLGNFNDMTLEESKVALENIKAIEKSGREILKGKKSERVDKVQKINSDIEGAIDPEINPPSQEEALTGRKKRRAWTKADAKFKEKIKAKAESLGLKTKEGLQKSFGKMMEWNLTAKTMLDFFDKTSETFGSGNLTKLIVDPIKQARSVHLTGLFKKQDLVTSKFAKIFGVDGVTNTTRGLIKAKKAMREQVQKWQSTPITLDVTVNEEPKSYDITVDEAMRIYAWSKNPDLATELYEKNGIGPSEIEFIKNNIGEEEVEFVDYIVEDFMDRYHDEINSTYKGMFYSNLPKVKNYFPVKRIGVKSDVDVDGDGSIIDVIAATGASALKNRSKSTSELQIGDSKSINGFVEGLFGHINEMEHFMAYAPVARDINVAINNPRFKEALSRWGLHRPLTQILKMSVATDIRSESDVPFLGRLVDKYTLAALASKVNMALKQSTSFVNAFPNYNYAASSDFGKAMMKIPGMNSLMFLKDMADVTLDFSVRGNKLFNELYRNSPRFRERVDSYGVTNPDLVKSVSKGGSYNKTGMTDKLRELLMSPIKYGDQVGILLGYGSLYKNAIRNGMTQEEAIKIFEEYEETQQTRSRIDRTLPQLSSKSVMRLFTAFKSSPILYLNQSFGSLNSMARQIKRGKMPKSKDFKTFVTNWAITNILFQAAASMPSLLMGDDDRFKEDLTRSAILGPLNGIFIAGSLMEWMYDVSTGRTKGSFSLGIDIFRPLSKMINEFIKEDTDTQEQIQQSAATIGYMLGIPSESFIQMYEGVENIGDGNFVEGWLRVMGYTDYAIEGKKTKGRQRAKR